MLWLVNNGLCNYSALARKLQKELYPNKKNAFVAIKAALLRTAKEYGELAQRDWEKEVERILKASSVEIRTHVAVASSKGSIGVPVIATASSKSGVMSVVDAAYVPQLKKKGVKVTDDLTLVILCSPPQLQETPGCVAAILDAIATEGINVLQFISCHTDTLMVMRNSDAMRAYEILMELTGKVD